VRDVFGFAFEGLSPGAALGVALGGAAALTAMYLLRPRRRSVVVAFAPLWFGAPGERRAERWARRLRRWLSLALQLAILAALVVAAAAPRPVAADGAGRSVVVLVDRSASMSARDEPGTRLGAARARARAHLAAMSGADRAMIAAFAADVDAASGFEPVDDEGAARLGRALDGVAPSEEAGDLPRALAFAAAALRGRPRPTILLVSDGAFSDDARARVDVGGALAGVDLRWAPVGRRARNVAIRSFGARAAASDGSTVEAAVTLRNFGDAPATVTLELAAGAARAPVERRRFTLAPGEARRHALPDVAAPDMRLEARLLEADDLPLDDRAFAVVPSPRRLRVLHVGARDLYLDGALLSLGDRVELERLAPAAAESSRARWAGFDAVIFDGVAPAPAPTEGHFLYLAPAGPGSPLAARGAVEAPVVSDLRRAHPLARHLDLGDVNVARADRVALAPGDVAVASSFGAPLVVARERPGLRVAVVTFDVRRSDLPMRPAFPLFVANALSWLAGADAREALPVAVGATARVPAPAGATRVEVVEPTGARGTWPARGGFAEGPIARAGFYEVDGAPLAASFADARESDTAPASTLVLGDHAVAREAAPPPARRPALSIATRALLVAAALLLLEWLASSRRWTV
jgi:hypothetical protein